MAPKVKFVVESNEDHDMAPSLLIRTKGKTLWVSFSDPKEMRVFFRRRELSALLEELERDYPEDPRVIFRKGAAK